MAENLPVQVIPVLQGFAPHEYVRHIALYGDRLTPGMWVGVGSVCKRNASPDAIVAVLSAIKAVRPDFRLHGFGLKLTALLNGEVRSLLHTADSMAWSDDGRKAARKQVAALSAEVGRTLQPREAREIYARRGVVMRDANHWREADAYRQRVEAAAALPPGPRQLAMTFGEAA